jgi:hypothetical protein
MLCPLSWGNLTQVPRIRVHSWFHFIFLKSGWKSLEIIGNHWKSLETIGKTFGMFFGIAWNKPAPPVAPGGRTQVP